MFYLLLIPFSLIAWLLGVSHSKNNSFAKYGFLAFLILPVLIDIQTLVIFITAFFMLGFLYDQEGSLHALYLRLKAVFSKNTTASVAKPSVKRKKRRFEYKKKREYSSYGFLCTKVRKGPQEFPLLSVLLEFSAFFHALKQVLFLRASFRRRFLSSLL